jgi:hypothetical protein
MRTRPCGGIPADLIFCFFLIKQKEDTQNMNMYMIFTYNTFLRSSHLPNYISELANHDNASEHRPVKHDNDIWLSKQYAHLNNLYYEHYSCNADMEQK